MFQSILQNNPFISKEEHALTLSLFHRRILQEIEHDPEVTLLYFIGDKVERHEMKGLVAVSGKFSCEIGEGSGKSKTVMTRGKTKRTGGICWPYPDCMDCPTRDMEEYARVAK